MIFMADTNAGSGEVLTGDLFLQEPMSLLEDYKVDTASNPYTCCNDTASGYGMNKYASDRMAVSGDKLVIDLLEGGSTEPEGPVTSDDLGYQCHGAEEHLPLRAHISFK